MVKLQGRPVTNVRRFKGGYVAASRRVRSERCDGGEVFVLAADGDIDTSNKSGSV